MNADRPAWWPTASAKDHADAGCAHPDLCHVGGPDYCPTCGRRIRDFDPDGCESGTSQRYCLDHAPMQDRVRVWRARYEQAQREAAAAREIENETGRPIDANNLHAHDDALVELAHMAARIFADQPPGCPACYRFGVESCAETVGVCDRCGQRRDVFANYAEAEREPDTAPVESICLGCLNDGEHFDSLNLPHPPYVHEPIAWESSRADAGKKA